VKKKKVAIIGINGLPARYGGFETLAENIVKELSNAFDFTVYCRKTPKSQREKSYPGAKLVYLPFLANGWQSIFFDSIATLHAWLRADTLLILGPVAGFILPLNFIFRKKLIVNYGGLNEWEREKLNVFEKKYLFINFKLACNAATYNIADNTILKESLQKYFKSDARVIRYGGDHTKPVIPCESLLNKYSFLSKPYYVSVSRAQLDNNLHLLLEAFSQLPDKILVLVSNWSVSEYGNKLYEKYKDTENLILLKAIYDAEELNCIRSNAIAYIHSHSRCGTAPSLVEAICLNLAIISFDVPTNRETTKEKAIFFKNTEDLKEIAENITDEKLIALKSGISQLKDEYLWRNIAKQYADLF
jgi:glycosyltransferase involved in cell wall biosynthesis